jgi:septal ring factor EnvC (AmiA/AmiB activator)
MKSGGKQVITKRAFWGYSRDSVQQVVQNLQAEHEGELRELQKELDQLKEQQMEWTKKLDELREQMAETDENEEMAKQLLAMHYSATEKVFEANQELNHMLKNQEDVKQVAVEKQKSVLSKVKTNLKRIIDQV